MHLPWTNSLPNDRPTQPRGRPDLARARARSSAVERVGDVARDARRMRRRDDARGRRGRARGRAGDGCARAGTFICALALAARVAGASYAFVGDVTSLDVACAAGSSATTFSFTQANGPTTTTCALVAYEAVRRSELARVNATAMEYDYAQWRANAEGVLATFGAGDSRVIEAAARNASAYERYAAAMAVNVSAFAALDAALDAADGGVATFVSSSGSNRTYSCTVPAGEGGLYVVVARGGLAGGVMRVTKPESSKTIRRTKLEDYYPKSGPSTGGTVITFRGRGFNDVEGAGMSCAWADGSFQRTVAARHLADGTVTCETSALSGALDIKLIYPDSCFEMTQFVYYQNPDPMLVLPRSVPRFGQGNLTVYTTNLQYAEEYGPGGNDATHAGKVNVTCAIGMGSSSSETASAIAVFPGELVRGTSKVSCMIPDITLPNGTHDVRLSFNGQQYMLPQLASTNPSSVSVTFSGPVLRMKDYYSAGQNGNEQTHLIRVPVELIGDNRRLVSVDIDVTYGGTSAIPGSSGDALLIQVAHAEARDNATSLSGDYDFMVYPRTLHWVPGDNGENFVYVRIINDRVHESALEALTITLVNAVNADISQDASAVVNIEDDDPAPLFAARPRNIAYPPLYRDVSEVVRIPIDIVGGGRFALPAVVDYTILTSGAATSAIEGIHYTAASGRLTWAPEQYNVTQFAEVTLHWANISAESSLRLTVNLTAVSNARVMRVTAGYNEFDDAALFIFGVYEGSCPPGTRRRDSSTYTAPPPLAPRPNPPPPPPPPPQVNLDFAILALSIVANTTAATSTNFPVVPEGISLQPPFDPAQYVYTASVPAHISGVQVYFQLRQSSAYISNRRLLAPSAVGMKYFTLVPGSNPISLRSNAPNGQASATYRFTITRREATSPPPSPPPLPPVPSSPPPPPPWSKPPPPPPEPPISAPPAPPAPPAPKIRPREPEDDPVCEYCPIGTYADDMDSLQCTPCAAGSASNSVRAKRCSLCPAGRYVSSSGSSQCLDCPADSYTSVAGSTLCSPCPLNATTESAGSNACTVLVEPVNRNHPDVYYVDVLFGVSFHQAGGSLMSFARNLGIDADADEAFKRALSMDISSKFNVTRGAIDVRVTSPGTIATLNRRKLLQDRYEVSTPCSPSENCVRAAAVKVTLQATEILRFGVVRDFETTQALIQQTQAKGSDVLTSMRNDPVAFFAATTSSMGGGVSGRVYSDDSTSVVVEKIPVPPRSTPNIFGDVNVALITVGVAIGMLVCTIAFLLRARAKTKRVLARIEQEVEESQKSNAGIVLSVPVVNQASNANVGPWSRLLFGSDSANQPAVVPTRRAVSHMPEQSQLTLAQLARFRERREQSSIQAMWQSRDNKMNSVGVRRVK